MSQCVPSWHRLLWTEQLVAFYLIFVWTWTQVPEDKDSSWTCYHPGWQGVPRTVVLTCTDPLFTNPQEQTCSHLYFCKDLIVVFVQTKPPARVLLVSWQPSVRHWFIRRLVRDVCILCIILLSYSWSLLLLWQDSMFIGELFVPEMVVCILLFIVKFLILNQFIVYFFSKFLIQTIVLRCYIWNYIVTCSRIIRTNFPFVDAQNWCYRHH